MRIRLLKRSVAVLDERTRKRGSVLDQKPGTGAQVSRRDMIRTVLGGAGSGLILSRTALAHPIGKYLTDGALLASADSQVAHEGWKPQCLDPQQNDTLIVLAEDIVPNSSKALANRFIDLLLSVDSDEVRKQFSTSLAAFDEESMHRFGHPFREVSDSNRQEILTLFSSEGSRAIGGPASSRREPSSIKSVDDQPTPYDHFQNLKTWIAGAYYSSEVGMRELGWTGTMFFRDYPGCQHIGGHV
jgi:hypothetical protein